MRFLAVGAALLIAACSPSPDGAANSSAASEASPDDLKVTAMAGAASIELTIKSFVSEGLLVQTAGERLLKVLRDYRSGALKLPADTQDIIVVVYVVPDQGAEPIGFIRAAFKAPTIQATDLASVDHDTVFGLAANANPVVGRPQEIVKTYCGDPGHRRDAAPLCDRIT